MTARKDFGCGPNPRDHRWKFESCGIDGNALRGEGPHRCNFQCLRCGSGARMENFITRKPKIRIRAKTDRPWHSFWRKWRKA